MTPPDMQREGERPTPRPVVMDLLGMGVGGKLHLWRAAARVQPLDRFAAQGERIVPGHYVLELRGKAVAAHVGNGVELGTVLVQIMGRNTVPVLMPRAAMEGDVLGRVIPEPENGPLREMMDRIVREVQARRMVAHRRRGWA